MLDQWIKCIGMYFIAALFYTAIRIPVLKKKNQKFFNRKELIYLCFVIYITAILEILIIPKINIFIIQNADGIELTYSVTGNFEEKVLNILPFATLQEQFKTIMYDETARHPWLNLTSNLLVMVPLPILINLINKNIKGAFPLLITFAVDIIIEEIQYYIGRSCDIDDIILNMLGAAGYLSYIFIKHKIHRCNKSS